MALFQNSVLKKYLAAQASQPIQEALAAYLTYFHNPRIKENIRAAKEEQFQEGFLRELFVKILGYTINPEPDFNLTTELKNIKDSKKTDGAILKDGNALAVIELKGTDTKDLDKIRDQAFNYKNNQPDCVYVITSNFEKLRVYIDNAVDYVEFNILAMDNEQFKLLWLLLQKDNLLQGLPKKIKEESLLAEEQITKQLYKDYSAFKQELWQDLVAQNPDQDELLLYKKSQKLLDRFLFIFFAEDKGLLPPNSIMEIVNQWQKLKELDEYRPIYERFKKYFGYLNTGRVQPGKAEIHAYNGGLFAIDPVLEELKISDNVLEKHVRKLTEYDFDTEVDTNILGHIFEHSLNDIENVRAQLAGEKVEKSKTKRKRDGVFYTPKYITKYIVDNTLGRLCTEKKAELEIIDEDFAEGKRGRQKKTIQKLKDKLDAYRTWLLQLTICDPACGSGAFLNQVLEFLIAEHRYVDELEAQLFDSPLILPNVENHILENNIFGVDINEESVEIARLSLWLRTAKKGRKLSSLNSNIKVGNSLIDDPEVAGDLAFNWEQEFPQVFAKGGFDVVVGNPPYVNIVNIENELERKFFQKRFETFKNKSDLYSFFIEKSKHLSKTSGYLGFIFPNSWMGTDSFSKFRKFITHEFTPKELIELPSGVFQDAVVTTVIAIFQNRISKGNDLISLKRYENQQFVTLQKGKYINEIASNDVYSYSFEPQIELKNISNRLGDVAGFTLGIKTSDDKRFIFKKSIDENYFKILRGKDIGKYRKVYSNMFIWYMPELIKEKPGGRPRVLTDFLKPKILIQDIAKSINAVVDEDNYLVNDTVNVIHEIKEPYSLYLLCAILNSRLINKWFSNQYPEGLHIKINQLAEIPLPMINELLTEQIEKYSKKLHEQNSFSDTYIKKFVGFIESKFSIAISSKLQNWPSLDFKGFLGELKKAKVKLSLAEEAEWMAYFNEQKARVQALQADIDRIDREIDALVYELYGLTEEEIRIVENN
jgi:hypothetical protein